jgi:hypothetical protein
MTVDQQARLAELRQEELRRAAERNAERNAERKLAQMVIRAGLKEMYPKYPFGLSDVAKARIDAVLKKLRNSARF